MKLDEWKNKELNRLLMEKFNFEKEGGLEEEKEELEEEKEELEETHEHPGKSCGEAHPDMEHGPWVEMTFHSVAE